MTFATESCWFTILQEHLHRLSMLHPQLLQTLEFLPTRVMKGCNSGSMV